MLENGVIIDKTGNILRWHMPEGRTSGSLPDSHDLWEFIWANRDKIGGIAHSHPGSGKPGPSHEDVTTFAAVESALGQRLNWWITSSDKLILCRHSGGERLDYTVAEIPQHRPAWLQQLRKISYETENGNPK